jgi:dethiobiotin synthetase
MHATVLATGTDIGKTHIACSLLATARAHGLCAAAFKPVMSGYSPDRLAESDAGRLALACGLEPTPEQIGDICLYAFEEPIAPNVAARREGVSIDFDTIVATARKKMDGHAGLFLVEGAGGVLSPINDLRSNADLAAALGIPSLLVTANYLGSVSHTLSAIEICQTRGIEIAAVIVSQPSPDHGMPAAFADELRRWTERPILSFEYCLDRANSKLLGSILDMLRPDGIRIS